MKRAKEALQICVKCKKELPTGYFTTGIDGMCQDCADIGLYELTYMSRVDQREKVVEYKGNIHDIQAPAAGIIFAHEDRAKGIKIMHLYDLICVEKVESNG
jgi:hypothetical protein